MPCDRHGMPGRKIPTGDVARPPQPRPSAEMRPYARLGCENENPTRSHVSFVEAAVVALRASLGECGRHRGLGIRAGLVLGGYRRHISYLVAGRDGGNSVSGSGVKLGAVSGFGHGLRRGADYSRIWVGGLVGADGRWGRGGRHAMLRLASSQGLGWGWGLQSRFCWRCRLKQIGVSRSGWHTLYVRVGCRVGVGAWVGDRSCYTWDADGESGQVCGEAGSAAGELQRATAKPRLERLRAELRVVGPLVFA